MKQYKQITISDIINFNKYNCNNSVLIAIISIIYTDKNNWNNRVEIIEIIVKIESLK